MCVILFNRYSIKNISKRTLSGNPQGRTGTSTKAQCVKNVMAPKFIKVNSIILNSF